MYSLQEVNNCRWRFLQFPQQEPHQELQSYGERAVNNGKKFSLQFHATSAGFHCSHAQEKHSPITLVLSKEEYFFPFFTTPTTFRCSRAQHKHSPTTLPCYTGNCPGKTDRHHVISKDKDCADRQQKKEQYQAGIVVTMNCSNLNRHCSCQKTQTQKSTLHRLLITFQPEGHVSKQMKKAIISKPLSINKSSVKDLQHSQVSVNTSRKISITSKSSSNLRYTEDNAKSTMMPI